MHLGWYFALWIRMRRFAYFFDPDPGSQNVANTTDPDPNFLSTDCKVAKIGIKNKSLRRVNFQFIMLSDDEVPEPEGELMLVLKERVQRIIMWLNQNFLLTEVPNHLKKLSTKFQFQRNYLRNFKFKETIHVISNLKKLSM